MTVFIGNTSENFTVWLLQLYGNNAYMRCGV